MKSTLLAVVLLFIVTLIRITFGQSTGDLRLVNGVTNYEGRVEVYALGQWGTICDDQFDMNDANVICRQLGFVRAVRAHGRAKYGQGSGLILMDGLSCNGRESRVDKCHFNGWTVNDCGHHEDASVECEAPPRISPNVSDIRLVCPPAHPQLQKRCNTCTKKTGCPSFSNNFGVQGVIEVYRNNKWNLLSGQNWDTKAAKVVCGQLGYPHLIEVPGLDKLYPSRNCSNKPVVRNLPFCRVGVAKFNKRLNDSLGLTITCNGNEGDLNECTTETSLSTNDVATVHCGYLVENSDKCGKSDPRKELYRLRGGPVPWVGRVEVRKNGKWGTICDLGWSIEDAHIVCRNLGYGTAKKIYSRAHFGRGSADVVYSNLRCRGTEINLSRCKSTTDIQLPSEVRSYCYQNSGDAGVECKTTHSRCNSEEPQSRLVGSGLVEVKGPEGWGRACSGVLDLMDAQVICRENQQKFAARILSVPSNQYPSSLLYSGYYLCKGNELYLKECQKSLNTFYRCVNITRIDCVSGLPDLVPNVKRFQFSLGYRYIDRLPMYYLTCALEEKCLASDASNLNPNQLRTIFRFDSLTMNFGTAAFEPHRPSSEWQWHACHQHYHSFEAFINYDILDTQRRKVAEGHKASFCLEDSFCHSGGYPQYRCSTGRQGISVNCGDLYARHLDCQWIDITGLSDGTYIVRQIVNPDRYVAESDYENNVIECTISIYNSYYYTSHNCTHSDHE